MTESYVRQSGFVVLPNAAVHDRGLSLSAIGMLAYLLALPPGASTGYRDLCHALGAGERVVRRSLAELAAGGYRHVVKYQRADGTWRSVAVHGAEPFSPQEARTAAAAQSGDLLGSPAKRRQTERAERPHGVTSENTASPQVEPSGRLPRHGKRPHVPTGLNTPSGYSARARTSADVSQATPAPSDVREVRCPNCGFLATEDDHECGTVAVEPTAEYAKARAALAAARERVSA